MIENVLYVSGGANEGGYLTEILSWDPLQEKWTHEGDLEMARRWHSSVAIPSNAIECAAVP